MIEKEIRLAQRAEEYKKSKSQKKGNSLEIGNKSDANYDAKQYMVSLQHVLSNYYDY